MIFPPPRDVLPHTGRAVLLDEILDDGDDHLVAAATITPSHPFFVEGHGVPVWVGIELMAQAIAAHAGLAGRRANRAPRRGMLLGTRHYHGHVAWFPVGARLVIHVEREFGDSGGAAACRCRIDCDGAVAAEATITIIEEKE